MKIRGTRIDFVFMKATEGNELKDRLFQKNWAAAKWEGLLRGAYHFYRPHIKSTLQAKHFIKTVKMVKGDLPPVLDIETRGPYSEANMRQGLKNWLSIIERHYGVKPIIYTNLNFYKKYLKGHFPEHYFWIAQYRPPGSFRTSPGLDSERWLFWQHSDQGLVNGVAGKVDFNVFQGNRRALEALTF